MVPMKMMKIHSHLIRSGCQLLRMSGSHRVYRSPEGKQFVISIGKYDSLGPPMLSRIEKQSGVKL